MSLLKPNLSAQLSEFIAQPAFPCAGAKTALTKDQVHVKQYDDLSCEMNNIDMLSDIYDFIHQFNMEKDIYSSLVFTFELPEVLNETVFDKLLWRKLQQLQGESKKVEGDRSTRRKAWQKKKAEEEAARKAAPDKK